MQVRRKKNRRNRNREKKITGKMVSSQDRPSANGPPTPLVIGREKERRELRVPSVPYAVNAVVAMTRNLKCCKRRRVVNVRDREVFCLVYHPF